MVQSIQSTIQFYMMASKPNWKPFKQFCCLYACRKVARDENNTLTAHTILPEWIPIIRTALGNPEWVPRTRKICSLHFDEKDRTFLGVTKRGIQRGAKPKHYLSNSSSNQITKIEIHKRVQYDNSDTVIITVPSSSATTTTPISPVSPSTIASELPTYHNHSSTTTTTTSSSPSSSSATTCSSSSSSSSNNNNHNTADCASVSCDDLVLASSPSSSSNFTATTAATSESMFPYTHYQTSNHDPPTTSSNINNIVRVSKNKYIIREPSRNNYHHRHVPRGSVRSQLEQYKRLLAISEFKVRNLTKSNTMYKNKVEILEDKVKDLQSLRDELLLEINMFYEEAWMHK